MGRGPRGREFVGIHILWMWLAAALVLTIIWLQRRAVGKLFLRAWRGRGELERLLLSGGPRLEIVRAARRCLMRSAAAADVLGRHGVFSMVPFDEDTALAALGRAKRLTPEGCTALRGVLRALNDLNAGGAAILALRCRFEWDVHAHERAGRALWSALKPGARWEGRQGKHWKELGFQGEDPATDFRGGGMLALASLVHFAERYPRTSRRMVAEAASPQHWHPFACTAINVTAVLIGLLRARCLDRELLHGAGTGGSGNGSGDGDGGGSDGSWCDIDGHGDGAAVHPAICRFHELFCTCLLRLHTRWVRTANKRDIMCFPPVLSAFKAQLVRELDAGDGQLAPRSAEEQDALRQQQ